MIDVEIIDKELSKVCDKFGFEWSDIHCEAFCVKVGGVWRYVWYDEWGETELGDYVSTLLNIIGEKDD